MSESELFPEATKFTYANTDGYQKDRIFDPYTYRHNYDEDQLETLLSKYVTELLDVHNESIKFMEAAPENKLLAKCKDSIEFGIHRIRSLKVLISVTQENLRNYYSAEEEIQELPIDSEFKIIQTHENSDSESEEEKFDRSVVIDQAEDAIMSPLALNDGILALPEYHPRVKVKYLQKLITGEKIASIPSVYITLACIVKMLERIKVEMYILENEECGTSQYKNVFSWTLKLASIFDYYYASLKAKLKNPFYGKEETDEIQEHFEFVEVLDEIEYYKLADKGYQEAGRVLGVASKCCKHTSMCRQLFSLAGWLPMYYFFKRKEGADKGLYFMNTLNKERFQRLNKWPQTGLVKSISKITSPKVKVEEKIFVQISVKDELSYKRNISSSKTPQMCKKDLDLPFRVKMKHYDPEEYLKIRITSSEDWDTVNWKKGKLKSPDSEPVTLPAAILYIHGGGFIGGSTGSYRNVLRKYATMTDCPVFSVDYRLAPEYKYPTQVSDSWLCYLWIRYYSEKYLGVKFEKIIVVGDSAGGCISLGVSLLAIQKGCISPDGLMLCYPGACGNRNEFYPSCLLSTDEPYLNTMFIDFCCTLLFDDEKRSREFICSPIYAPRKLLKKLPPMRVGIPAIDPLRDAAIELFRKCIKSGCDVKGKIYKHLFHGYLEMDAFPFYMKDCELAFNDSVEYILELIGPGLYFS
ncbi:unnamed protein product [Moneuplotes crassus]|uniref:Alpha/beta hydrolase fold-3 domain-containing protein n=1 Tax=Euplotes crassus TaxID=5936 RepID=A0AAD1X3Z3_EUPCR|nr:unnamed protein product [Moneuplotes crassus]